MAAKYQVLTQIEHVLKRPGMYVGSTSLQAQEQYVPIGETFQKKNLLICPALYKLFDECIVNCYDQNILDPTLKNIKVDIDSEKIRVWNDGKGIPIEKFDSDTYVPEVIFGRLLSGSNFDDSSERFTGGQNGLGVKLCNIFSKEFVIELADGEQVYHQTFRNHMGQVDPPSIKRKKHKPYVCITFVPDMTLFGMNSIDEQHIELFRRRTFDLSALTRSNVHVSFNGVKLASVKEFVKYVSMFQKEPVFVYKEKGWELSVSLSDQGFSHMSFVNGIHTHVGGTHVDFIVYQICGEVIKMFDEKNKKRTGSLKPFAVKEKLFVLLKCELPNPTFSSQTKEQCTLPMKNVPSLPIFDPKHITKIYKQVAEDLLETLEAKEKKQLAKSDGKKTERVILPKLDDARFAGTAKSDKCTLIITEGDSARTFAIAGLSSVDRSYYGVFPLRGKLLNVRDASVTQINGNAEITALKQILGLKQDKKYTALKDLRYGRLMILTDQDLDGHHIKGLVMNWIDHFWPELFQLGFACSMFTPIVKALRGTSEKVYYSVLDFEKDQSAGKLAGYKIKYFKGLGTSTAKEAKEYFARIQQNTVTFKPDEDTRDVLSKAFKKDRADERKTWILENTGRKDFTVNNPNITKFINDELVQFSIYDNERSIPHVMDGLKPSQRKILYTVLEKCGNEEIKVAQLAPRVAEFTHYHHGEQSLVGACVGMAQDFLGSNQVNLLLPKGQFGSRLLGGKDSASARYIFTQVNPLTLELFPKVDTPLLNLETSDGFPVEPTYFCPILPMVLVNGANGIGTGFSTFIPTYRVKDILENVQRCMRGEPQNPMSPYYEGFRGSYIDEGNGKYRILGAWNVQGRTLHVTELPVGVWTDQLKDTLDSLTWNYINLSTENQVNVQIEMPDSKTEEEVVAMLPLKKLININNMYLFDTRGKIHKYSDPRDIISEFVSCRNAMYEKRRITTIASIQESLSVMEAKIRFIEAVMQESVRIFRKTRAEIIAQLTEQGFPSFKGTFDLYLGMKVESFTDEKIRELQRSIVETNTEKRRMETTTSIDLWNEALRTFH